MQRRSFLKSLALTPMLAAGANAESSDSKNDTRLPIDSSGFSKKR